MESKKRKSDVLNFVSECSEDDLAELELKVKSEIDRRNKEEISNRIESEADSNRYALDFAKTDIEGLESMDVSIFADLATRHHTEDGEVDFEEDVTCMGFAKQQPPWISELGVRLGDSNDLEVKDLVYSSLPDEDDWEWDDRDGMLHFRRALVDIRLYFRKSPASGECRVLIENGEEFKTVDVQKLNGKFLVRPH
jgi:hypothetical protein